MLKINQYTLTNDSSPHNLYKNPTVYWINNSDKDIKISNTLVQPGTFWHLAHTNQWKAYDLPKQSYNENILELKIDAINRINHSIMHLYQNDYNNENQNVSSKYPLIFVHIPKTAGNSICKSLDIKKENMGHGTLIDLKMLINPDIYKQYKKVAVVRNPFDRFVSLYTYTKKKGYYLRNFFDGYEEYSFEDFFWNLDVHRDLCFPTPCIENNNYWWSPTKMMSCCSILVNETSQVDMDYILRFENLEKDWKNMFNDLNITPPPLPVKNSSDNKKHYSEYYKCKTGEIIKEFIYRKFENDFKYFGYKFEEKA
jgi:hypothetical protein